MASREVVFSSAACLPSRKKGHGEEDKAPPIAEVGDSSLVNEVKTSFLPRKMVAGSMAQTHVRAFLLQREQADLSWREAPASRIGTPCVIVEQQEVPLPGVAILPSHVLSYEDRAGTLWGQGETHSARLIASR